MEDRIKQITKLLADVDPIGLINLGCPKDEYSPEAKAIDKYLDKNGFVNLNETVKQIFLEYFEESISNDDASEIVKKLEELEQVGKA